MPTSFQRDTDPVATYHVTRLLPYTPEQVFELVGDVAAYPQFVPWITAMQAGEPQPEGEGVSVLDATASVGFSFLKEAFSTRVRRDAPAAHHRQPDLRPVPQA